MQAAAAIFDLDGTLADTLQDIGAAMNFALESLGQPTHPLPAYRHFIGEGVRRLAERALPAGRRDLDELVLERYRARYADKLIVTSRPYDGIPDALRLLAPRVKLGVLSNKPDPATQLLVRTLFPQVRFGVVFGERPSVPRKPDPAAALEVARLLEVDPERCAFVGDTAIDIRTAKAAGMKSVGVSWGFRGAAELRAEGADVIIDHPSELDRAI